ncbi:hypothetical protein A2U01_0083670, partial [Trifolium medium]|nr:hypothetical protein [Trifolium medium]
EHSVLRTFRQALPGDVLAKVSPDLAVAVSR